MGAFLVVLLRVRWGVVDLDQGVDGVIGAFLWLRQSFAFRGAIRRTCASETNGG